MRDPAAAAKAYFHAALVGGTLPLVGWPFVALAAMLARRAADESRGDPRARRWARRTLALVAIDALAAASFVAVSAGLVPVSAPESGAVAAAIDHCAPEAGDASSMIGTLVSYGIVVGATCVIALVGWWRGVRGGLRVWPAFVAIPVLGAVAGSVAARALCAGELAGLALEGALVGSEIVLVSLAGLAVWLARRGPWWREVLLEPDEQLSPARTILLGVLYVATWVPRVLVIALPLFALARALGVEGGSADLGAVLAADRSAVALAMTFVAGAVLAPIGEELLFRGLLLPHVARISTPWAAIAISALMFGALHEAHGVARIGPMAIGAILGWARLRSGTLRAPIAIHAGVNAFALSVAWLANG